MQFFAYLAAWLGLLCLATLGLVLCLVVAVFASHRQLAKQVAGGILGSLPGVFVFQVLVAPLVAMAVVAVVSMQPLTHGWAGASQVAFSVLALLLTIGVFAGVSLLGFFVGWGVGYRVASGVPLFAALRASRVLAGPLRFASRLRRQSAA